MLITKLGGGLEALTLPAESKTTGHITTQRMKDLEEFFFFPEHLLPPSQRDINGNTR